MMDVWLITTIILVIFYLISMLIMDRQIKRMRKKIQKLSLSIVNQRPNESKENTHRDSQQTQRPTKTLM